jgi:hypothetical protein
MCKKDEKQPTTDELDDSPVGCALEEEEIGSGSDPAKRYEGVDGDD